MQHLHGTSFTVPFLRLSVHAERYYHLLYITLFCSTCPSYWESPLFPWSQTEWSWPSVFGCRYIHNNYNEISRHPCIVLIYAVMKFLTRDLFASHTHTHTCSLPLSHARTHTQQEHEFHHLCFAVGLHGMMYSFVPIQCQGLGHHRQKHTHTSEDFLSENALQFDIKHLIIPTLP